MKSFITSVLTIGVLAGVGTAVGFAIAFTHQADAQIVYQSKEVVVQVEADAPVLDRIAKCESGNTQFAKDGQVLVHVNKNGTWDVGKYQINSIHGGTATKLGMNLYTEDGNTAFAKWMYANLGTGDWAASQSCWKK